MTTTDLWITDDAGQELISYSGGLFGPASTGHDLVRDLLARGEATGDWSSSTADVTTSGVVLTHLIRSLGDGYRLTDDRRIPVPSGQVVRMVDAERRYRIIYVEV